MLRTPPPPRHSGDQGILADGEFAARAPVHGSRLAMVLMPHPVSPAWRMRWFVSFLGRAAFCRR